ncbi:MAG: hypothetical protein DRR19_13105, partial [Candidatus Parabeggiatoa sp. nov. 1]
ALFKLEKSRTKSETQQTLKMLVKWLKTAPPSLRTAFKTWFRRVKLPRHLPNAVLPEFIDLQEIENMLETTADNWLEQSRDEGRKEGRKEGLQEGESRLLISLLEEKFGSLTIETQAIIYRFSETSLLKCAKRLFTAQTVQEVIKDEPLETKKGPRV